MLFINWLCVSWLLMSAVSTQIVWKCFLSCHHSNCVEEFSFLSPHELCGSVFFQDQGSQLPIDFPLNFIWSHFSPKRHLNLDNFLLYSIHLSHSLTDCSCTESETFYPVITFIRVLCAFVHRTIVEDGSVNRVGSWRLNPFHESDCLQLSHTLTPW